MCPCGCVQRHNGGEGPACNLPCLVGRKQDSHHSHPKSQLPANSEEGQPTPGNLSSDPGALCYTTQG